MTRAHPEHGQAVETQGDAEVVDDRDVGIACVALEVSFPVRACRFQQDRDDGEDGLDLDVFWLRDDRSARTDTVCLHLVRSHTHGGCLA